MNRAALASLFLLLGGCSPHCGSDSAPSASAVDAAETDDDAEVVFASEGPTLPLPANTLPVPLVRQQRDFSCGNVATLAVLRFWDEADYAGVTESSLYAPLHTTPEDGTDPAPMADYVSTVPGFTAEVRRDVALSDLTASIDRGEPVIVDLQAWQAVPHVAELVPWASDWEDGHYAVLAGYDDRELVFMDPSTSDKYAYIPRDEIESRWHDVITGTKEHVQHLAIFVHAGASRREAGAPRRHASGDAIPLH